MFKSAVSATVRGDDPHRTRTDQPRSRRRYRAVDPGAWRGAACRGEAFLTEAFRAFGSLAAENRVARITRLVRCPGGSTGDKLFLSVEYERADRGCIPTCS